MSDQHDDGGPAYPTLSTCRLGMTLLDWFAGQTVAGLNACESNAAESHHALAQMAYDQAEAMIAEKRRRERGCNVTNGERADDIHKLAEWVRTLPELVKPEMTIHIHRAPELDIDSIKATTDGAVEDECCEGTGVKWVECEVHGAKVVLFRGGR